MAGRGGKTEYSYLDSLNAVCKALVDNSQRVSNFITNNREYVSKKEELKSIGDLYFENITKTLNLLKVKNKNTDEFSTRYESVYNEQVMLSVKIRELHVVLEKKHKNVKRRKRFGYITLGAAFVPFAALSLLAISSTMVAKSFNPQGANAGQNFVERLKKLPDFLKDYDKSVEAQKDLSLLIEKCIKVNIGVMKTIKNLVE